MLKWFFITLLPQLRTSMGVCMILYYSFATMKCKYGTCLYDSLLLLCHSDVQVWYVFIWFFITLCHNEVQVWYGVYMILYYSFAAVKYKYGCLYNSLHMWNNKVQVWVLIWFFNTYVKQWCKSMGVYMVLHCLCEIMKYKYVCLYDSSLHMWNNKVQVWVFAWFFIICETMM